MVGPVYVFIYERLRDWAALEPFIGDRIYPDTAPDEEPVPYVLITQNRGRDISSLNVRLASEPVMNVQAVTDEDSSTYQANRIALHLDEALTSAPSRTIAYEGRNYYVGSLTRETDYAFSTPKDDRTYRNVGGLYRAHVQEIS